MITYDALKQLERRYEKRIRGMQYDMEKIMQNIPRRVYEQDVAPNFYKYISREEKKLEWIKKRKKHYVR